MLSCSKKPGISRVALSAIGAFAAAAACMVSTSASANAFIQATVPATLKVCVVDALNRSFTINTGITTNDGSAIVTQPSASVAAGTCQTVATDGLNGSGSAFTSTIVLPSIANLDHADCFSGIGACPGGAVTTTLSNTVSVNLPHGGIIQYTLGPDDVVTTGCTVTRGFILNQLDLLTNGIGKDMGPIIINGVTLTKAQILTALSTPVKGNLLIQLKAQLITALANISLGATTNAAVDAAIVSAQALLAANSNNNTLISAAVSTLTAFNEGTAGGGASLHCTDAEEAVLKDKAF